tara:strand:+ start:171 stop:665 length:495 start_codon:yes stop_codon:yes gene_type:complete
MKKSICSCLFISLTLLSSCGYTLKESSNALTQKNIIVLANNSNLNLELISQLRAKGNKISRVENMSEDHDLKIKIKEHQINKFSGATGFGARTTQARLDYMNSYEIVTKDNKVIENTFNSTSYLNFNQSDLLAMEKEEMVIVKSFINDSIKNIEFLLSLNKNEN